MEVAEQATTTDDLEAIVGDFPEISPDSLHKPVVPDPTARVRMVLHPAVWLVPAALLAVALLPLPYGYYIFLRLVVCGATALLTFHDYRQRGRASGWTIAMAGIALLFNPVISVGLTREIWTPINIGTSVTLILHLRSIRR